jgi:hypothetical protein
MIDLNISGSDKHIIYDEYNRRHNTSPILSSDVELLLQQIDILFDTTPREVFGHEEFGTTYDDYLYNLQISGESLADAVLNDLNTLDLLGFDPKVEVFLLEGTEQDIALVNIKLSRYSEQYEKNYKITR